MSDGPRRAPIEVIEVDHQVGRVAQGGTVDLLGPEYFHAHPLPVRARYRPELLGQLLARLLVAAGGDHTPPLTPLHVEEDAGVVAAPAPGPRRAPVHGGFVERDDAFGFFLELQVASLDKPLVDAEGPVHRLRSVVGDDKEHGVFERLQELPQPAVYKLVVLVGHALVGIAGLVLRVLGIEILPEGVTQAVYPDLHHHEEVPRLRSGQMLHDIEMLLGHLEELFAEDLAVLHAELDVEGVRADQLLDLASQLGRVGVLLGVWRREEARDAPALHRFGRVGGGDADEAGAFPVARQHVPDPGQAHGVGVRGPPFGVGEPPAVAEAVESQASGARARGHHLPGGHRDGRVAAPQGAVDAALDHPLEVRHLLQHPSEEQLRRGGVEPYDDQPSGQVPSSSLRPLIRRSP